MKPGIPRTGNTVCLGGIQVVVCTYVICNNNSLYLYIWNK